jgi:hypothetical protein
MVRKFSSENLLKGIRIQNIGWNGEYWLVGIKNEIKKSDGLVMYDGSKIIDLSVEFQNYILSEK